MKRLALRKPLAAGALTVVFALGSGWAAAQSLPGGPPVNVGEVRRILQIARESGFSQAEIGKITVDVAEGRLGNLDCPAEVKRARAASRTPGQLQILAMACIQEVEARKKAVADELRRIREKPFLTVQDLFAELSKGEKEDLKKMRDELLFVE